MKGRVNLLVISIILDKKKYKDLCLLGDGKSTRC